MNESNFETRRDFLKAAGFTVAAAAAGCARAPVEHAIPYLTASEAIVPGRAYWMASTCHGCPARCGVLVKCRDGRPIKLEGNPEHPLSRGGLCAVGQATVLELYDSKRLGGPLLHGRSLDWAKADAYVAQKLSGAKKVRVLSSTLASPAASRAVAAFLARFEDGSHVVYDVPSCSAIADAHAKTHLVRAIPHYDFARADVIVSIDADFLGTWISPVEFTKAWSNRPEGAWHVQYEGRMSLTGSKADQRVRMHPSEVTTILRELAATERVQGRALPHGRSLVVCGSNALEDQLLVNALNVMLGSYGNTLHVDRPSRQREGNDRELDALVAELGSIDALFVVDCNPAYDLPSFDTTQVPLVVAIAPHRDETTKNAHLIAPDHHFLESWRDSEPVAGVYTVTQPAIAPLRNTRSFLESFATWSGAPVRAYDAIKTAFAGNWDQTLHDGFAVVASVATGPGAGPSPQFMGGAAAESSKRTARANTLQLVLYPSVAMLDGRHAHNPWLHELPDPITKITWDNVASLSPKRAKQLGVTNGDVVDVNGIELPAFVQPGQHDDVVAIALGYGRAGTDRFAKIGPQWLQARTHLAAGEPIGRRVAHLATADRITVTRTGGRHELATTQLHDSAEGRNLDGAHPAEHEVPKVSLYPAKAKGPHRWAMAIDLERCTGCSGCVVACQAENNVPVVGKDEVLREREMHWIRIDRYYEGEGDQTTVAYQPMMCQHCGNAPCETVCPVAATVHSADGLNQQVYNRCVGTRYCANNCPYKVRRFNWFDYPREDRFANLVLNPDVAVRSRGVMEKCSMCVQRIEEARIQARQLGTPIADGAIQMACEQSCPANAIVFGDLQDSKSRIAALRRDPRYFRLLEELNVDPGVGYVARASGKKAAHSPSTEVTHA